jgi:hypothetical protein
MVSSRERCLRLVHEKNPQDVVSRQETNQPVILDHG